MQKRRIAYVSGTRADFGLMASTLTLAQADKAIELFVVATGMHLDAAYGMTVNEITAAGLPVPVRIEVEQGPSSGAMMARNIGQMVIGFVDAFEKTKPDVVLVLGDRGEMLAAALAAIHLNGITVCHIHGGERSGTVDEPVRHAISKLAHFHFVATDESRDRLVRMGEDQQRITVVGAPGLDGLEQLANGDTTSLLLRYGLDAARPFALLVYHPVVQEAAAAGHSTDVLLSALKARGIQTLALKPNSDGGSADIVARLESAAGRGEIAVVTHLHRKDYVTMLAAATLLIGNSSSGIIEAATVGTPVVNIGTRQNMRQRNANVIDAESSGPAIEDAIVRALASGRYVGPNIYGRGDAGRRIVRQLAEIDLTVARRSKINAY